MSEIQLPLFSPTSTWAPPASLPGFENVRYAALDVETRDEKLTDLGPGFLRNDGYVVGVAVRFDTGFKAYLPVRHATGPNLDPAIVGRWIRNLLKQKQITFCFTNAQYDLGWLLHDFGATCAGVVEDVSIMAALIDEEDHDGYGLDHLSFRYLKRRKEEGLLRQAAQDWGINPKKELWKLPASLVGAYAEGDVELTLQLRQVLRNLIDQENLNQVFQLECDVTPVLFRMMMQGIRVDLNYAQQLNERWLKDEKALLKECGLSVSDIWSTDVLARICRQHNIRVPQTEKGNDSVKNSFMEQCDHPALLTIRKARAINRTRSTFLEDVLIRGTRNGRIFPQYIQIASDDGGTRTRRLACKRPNAQQFPKRSTLFDAKSIRKCLLPEEGKLWAKFDYWSQEPTLQCHYGLVSNLAGAAEVAEGFRLKKKLYTIIEEATNGRCNYDQAKMVVLGRSYGMGAEKMAASLGMSIDDCERILQAFDSVVGYIAVLANRVSRAAEERGYIRTIDGGHRHFNFWEVPKKYRRFDENGRPVMNYQPRRREEAERLWPGLPLQRAWCYKAFNALIQGSAAGQTKTALVMIDRALGLPQMTVHDEISKSVKDEKEALQMKEIMENCIPLKCPAQTDMDLGESWC